MSKNIVMPAWGLTMKEGKVTKWFKAEGDFVQIGELLFEVETEKITNEVESIAGGVLCQIVVQEGSTVPVGAVLAVVAKQGETPQRIEGITVEETETIAAGAAQASADRPSKPKKGAYVPASPVAKRLAKELGIDLALVPGTGKEGRITEGDVRKFHEQGPPVPKMTPVAQNIVRQKGLDISTIQGSGERGKITKKDVERAMAAPAGEAPVTSIPMAGMRKTIADNMHASLQNSAQLTIFTEVDVTEMVRYRDLVQQKYGEDETVRISYNAIIIFALSRVLRQFPIMNSTLVGEEILLHERMDIGIAVALPDGLIVPKLRNAGKKSLIEIADEARELAKKAREMTVTLDDMVDGTFTISNVSMLGVDGFTPILNPPETAILGVGRIIEKPAVYEGEIRKRSMMTLSLTIDHRVVDGAPGMQFLQELAKHLQDPVLLTM